MPQEPTAYLQGYVDAMFLKDAQTNYKERFYRIWREPPKESKEEVMWPHRAFSERSKLYGVNLKRLEKSFYDKMAQNANFDAYMQVAKKALTIRGTNIRAFPTDEMVFKNPNLPGEGFPFDYLQNSFIAANKPLLVSHFSKNRQWVFVFSSFTSGWVKVDDIVFISQSDAKAWQDAKQAFVLVDNKPIYTAKGDFLFDLRLGMYLPVVDEDEKNYTVMLARRENIDTPRFIKIKLPKDELSLSPLLFTKENIAKVLSQLQKTRYGWGGMFALRDCSATMRDYFAPFGIWIGRNSSVQAQTGAVVSLEGLSEEEKKIKIKQEAIPFETLLYRPGHIALYIGEYNGKIAIFQNLWGIKTKQGKRSGRVVVGRSVYSTLDLGSDLPFYDKDASFLKRLKSFNIVTQE